MIGTFELTGNMAQPRQSGRDRLAELRDWLEQAGIEFAGNEEGGGASEGVHVTRDQCKAALKLLSWSRGRSREHESIDTISAYEIAGRMVVPRTRKAGRDRVARMSRAFEVADVEFATGDGKA